MKRLESGEETIELDGHEYRLANMSPNELQQAFQRLSAQSQTKLDDDLLRAKIWAVLFEALGRTQGKYPHLAQQFALISTDMGVTAPSRVLQLATGEGKSHFVAMRAARHAGLEKVVDICTAKRSLAERDHDEYQSFFKYLGLTTTTINPKSTHDDYTKNQIHFTTMGDLSLCFDELSYKGTPVEIDKRKRIGLFDEFDFIRFVEGLKTQYNYARPAEKTPKEMMWFYQAVNAFYDDNKAALLHDKKISADTIRAFANFLREKAGPFEDRRAYLAGLTAENDPLPLVQWLQSAHEAATLKLGTDFTVREEPVTIGKETYPMREIIPLSIDNQKMIGSTYSGGVHQLLAVRLNSIAETRQEPQNYYVHPESHIVSSKVASELITSLWANWEGFTGTISTAQAAMLHAKNGTQVLHVPTNQRDLRHWHKPQYFKDETDRLKAVGKALRHVHANGSNEELINKVTAFYTNLAYLPNPVRDLMASFMPEHFAMFHREPAVYEHMLLLLKRTPSLERQERIVAFLLEKIKPILLDGNEEKVRRVSLLIDKMQTNTDNDNENQDNLGMLNGLSDQNFDYLLGFLNKQFDAVCESLAEYPATYSLSLVKVDTFGQQLGLIVAPMKQLINRQKHMAHIVREGTIYIERHLKEDDERKKLIDPLHVPNEDANQQQQAIFMQGLRDYNGFISLLDLDGNEVRRDDMVRLTLAEFNRFRENQVAFLAMVRLIKETLAHANQALNRPIAANHFVTLFKQIVAYHRLNPTINFETLVAGVIKFKDAADDVLATLTERLENDPAHTLEYLYSGVAQHLTTSVHAESQAITRAIIESVYASNLAHDEATFIDDIAGRLRITENELPEARKHRTVLMHLLYQGVLTTGEHQQPELEKHSFKKDNNNAILDEGFAHYNRYTKAVLAQNELELTPDQQLKLLHLTDELQIITHQKAPDDLVPAVEKAEQDGSLKKELAGVMQGYKARWKGAKREEQRAVLEAEINVALGFGGGHGEDEDDDEDAGTTYNGLLKRIFTAKHQAIDDDIAANQLAWFKFNSFGRSRYFQTLNQMEKLILQHWTHSKDAVASFRTYQALNKTEYQGLAQRLHKALTGHRALHPVNKRFGLFSNAALDDAIVAIIDKLEDLNLLEDDEEALAMQSDEIRQLSDLLTAHSRALPGHLFVLANELMARSESLIVHLKAEEDRDLGNIVA